MGKVPPSESQGKGGPALLLFGNDVVFDQALLLCDRRARSFWSDLFAVVLHNAPVRGYLLQRNGEPHTPKTLARIFPDREEDIAAWLEELVRNRAAYVTGAENDPHAGEHPVADGVIYCKRQAFKEPAKRARDVANGKLGGNPELLPAYDGGYDELRKAAKRESAAERQRRRRQRIAQEKREREALNQAETNVTPQERDTSRTVTRESRQVTGASRFENSSESEDEQSVGEGVTGVNPHNHLPKPFVSLPVGAEHAANDGADAGPPATLTGGGPAGEPDLAKAGARERRDAALRALSSLPPSTGAARADLPDGPDWWRRAAEVLIVADPDGWRTTWSRAVPIGDGDVALRAPSLFAVPDLRRRADASRGLLGFEIRIEGPAPKVVGA